MVEGCGENEAAFVVQGKPCKCWHRKVPCACPLLCLGECLDCSFYSFVVWDVGVKGSAIVTRMVLYGSGVGIWRMMLRKCVVSLTQEGMRGSRGLR